MQQTNTQEIHHLCNMPFVSDRLAELGKNYITKSLEQNNPLIQQSANEFFEFAKKKIKKVPTLFNILVHKSRPRPTPLT